MTKFGSHPLPDPDPRIFKGLFNIARYSIARLAFCTVQLMSLAKLIGSLWNIYQKPYFVQGSHSPLNLGSHPDPYPDSGYGFRISGIWTRFALAEDCALSECPGYLVFSG